MTLVETSRPDNTAGIGASRAGGGSGPVSRYIPLRTLTTEGRKTLHQHPERMQEVDNEIQTFGCKVIDQYAVLGAYDFVTVVDAPDNETVAHLAVDLGS